MPAALDRPHARLAYQEDGTGPLVVYAHGALSSRDHDRRLGFDWSPITAAGHRLARYDARGHGRSTGRPVEADYAYPALGADYLALCEHLAPGERIDAVGSSMGAATVLYAALAEPERFDRLVLAMPGVAWQAREARRAGLLGAADLVEQQGGAAFLAAARRQGPPPVLAGMPDFPPEFDVAEELLPTLLRAVAANDLPAPQALRTLPHPGLVLCWDTDPTHPEETARQLADLLPGAELHVSRTLADIHTWGRRAAEFLAR
ncbi:alpha/beta fold hydrolase [Kitasatospora viridis]|uniref:Pimeloyl-ACP methyl ester carboxylesterase n=1 Tax=Kitasatospora viridis TaxID=281105 RepID=A0A561TT58_9ACTN|nr:alpha/beta fold hydrolase [Kitasatospora viridis]TWF90291.1 pimeloyl-ACP methyl ester carboxylesterase [Kitasatospora viridis]